MKYIKTFESYNKSGKDDEIVEEVLELISLRNDERNLQYYEKSERYNNNFSDRFRKTNNIGTEGLEDYLGYEYTSYTCIYIKEIKSKSNLIDINQKNYNSVSYDIIHCNPEYKLDVNPILSKKLYDTLYNIQKLHLDIENKNTYNKISSSVKDSIDDEVKNNMSDIGIM